MTKDSRYDPEKHEPIGTLPVEGDTMVILNPACGELASVCVFGEEIHDNGKLCYYGGKPVDINKGGGLWEKDAFLDGRYGVLKRKSPIPIGANCPEKPQEIATKSVRTTEKSTESAGNLLEMAQKVLADREKGYGKRGENAFPYIVSLWNAFLSNRKDQKIPLTNAEASDLLALMKLGRKQCRRASGMPIKRDDNVDMVNYIALSDELESTYENE